MNTNDLYQEAIKNVGKLNSWSGVYVHTLKDGTEIFCCLDKVAGRSIRPRHFRTTYRVRPVGQEFSKSISRKNVIEMLREGA